MGLALMKLDRYEEALVEHRAALDIYTAVLGKCRRDVATTRNNLGDALMKFDRQEEALVGGS